MGASKHQNIKTVIRDLLADRGVIANRDVVEATGLTSQGVHYHLQQLVNTGEIEREGAGRGVRYRRNAIFSQAYSTAGLEEHRVWQEEISPLLEDLASESALRILEYGSTEMVNNVVDHSGAGEARVAVWSTNGSIVVEVVDEGVGALEHLRSRLGLEDTFHALQELSKGKATSSPDRHTGEGIFFTSKAVDVFVLESNGVRWTVDNFRRDEAVGESTVRTGTRVRLEIGESTSRRLREDVFDHFTYEDRFARSRASVRLFELSVSFVSRSEAKRLTRGLERFTEVEIDFAGVADVGQGFVDEVFRVWAGQYPETRLIPVNMSDGVEAMVKRGLAAGDMGYHDKS
ncbi:MAG: STAS-like domain-containing protein [Acidimicrobiia bacterium]